MPAQPAPVVEVTVEATMPAPEVRLTLPDRRTTSIVERDAQGRITRTDQIERDA
jgi:hypothetical protein